MSVRGGAPDPVSSVGVKLPATDVIASKLGEWNSSVILIQHARADTVGFVASLTGVGVNIASVIAIPYSSDDLSIERMEAYTVVHRPELAYVASRVSSEIRRVHSEVGARVIVQDVGGHFADALAADRSLGSMVKGVVEETRQGLWRYQEIADLLIPVIQIADSSLKQIEARYVGGAVALSALEAVRALGVATIGERVAVVGYGDIGASCAKAVRGLANTVHVWDSDPIRRIAAIADGFLVASPLEIARDCRLIIGCTGKPSVGPEWFANSSGDYFLASGSSRDIEFSRMVDTVPGHQRVAPSVPSDVNATINLDVGMSRVRILRGGLPINFSSTSLPHTVIDLVFAQLVAGLGEIEHSRASPGVAALSRSHLEQIASVWLAEHWPEMRDVARPVAIEGR